MAFIVPLKIKRVFMHKDKHKRMVAVNAGLRDVIYL